MNKEHQFEHVTKIHRLRQYHGSIGKAEEIVTIILKSDKKLLKIKNIKELATDSGENMRKHQKDENLIQVGHNFGSGHDGGDDLAYRFLTLSFPIIIIIIIIVIIVIMITFPIGS